jgi:DNA-binding NtrC family response regulator
LGVAVDHIKKHQGGFDVVITDFIIGDALQGGMEILDNVRLTQPYCLVILLTGYFERLDEQTEQNNQFSYIAQKPIGFAKISQIISSFLDTNMRRTL